MNVLREIQKRNPDERPKNEITPTNTGSQRLVASGPLRVIWIGQPAHDTRRRGADAASIQSRMGKQPHPATFRQPATCLETVVVVIVPERPPQSWLFIDDDEQMRDQEK